MKIILFALTALLSTTAFAGPGHGHSHGNEEKVSTSVTIDAQKSQEIGKTHIKRLIEAGKIDSTWEQAIFDKAEKKTVNNKTEWLVTFNNEEGEAGKKLYIFLKTNGDFVAANFTGK